MSRRLALAAVLAVAAPAARAQTMLDQQQRLIDIHALLLDLPPVQAPGALRAWEATLGLEVIGVPPIDGTTGTKRQITASDRTPVFPRPRLALGLPAPEDWRAFVGVSYIPPVSINEVSSHYAGLEAGLAYAPGALRVGLRGTVQYSESKSPVTEPDLRDTLDTFQVGGDLSAGYGFELGSFALTPYGGVGVTYLAGDFTVTSDGVVLKSRYTGLVLLAGVRVLFARHWEGVAELDAFPGRVVHPSFRVAYVMSFGHG
jgi:opacity protein-like surface antigen